MAGIPRIKVAGALLLILIAATPAHAFRCGNKIVIENMHEQQVLNVCGEPAAIRHLGYALRGFKLPTRRSLIAGKTAAGREGYTHYAQEVAITEYIYNFGPRKFMRRLVFEGSILVSIESMGYGYREKGE